MECLRAKADLFACSLEKMPGINPSAACHKLNVNSKFKPINQKRRHQSTKNAHVAKEIVKGLPQAKFIFEINYTQLLSNAVLVKMASRKWHMCFDYTDLNKACPKDTYLLPNIDKLMDNSSDYKLLSFMDAYSYCNQIPMDENDKKHTTFMIEGAN